MSLTEDIKDLDFSSEILFLSWRFAAVCLATLMALLCIESTMTLDRGFVYSGAGVIP